MSLVFIGVGGFVGAIARYLIDGAISDATGGAFPWGTLAVNLSGSFVIGLLFSLVVERAALTPDLRGPLMIGFVGSYTTFSTLALESWRMFEDGAWLAAGANVAGSTVLGIAAVIAGLTLGRAL